jgi:GNAT superfamily N-acetyltransferase
LIGRSSIGGRKEDDVNQREAAEVAEGFECRLMEPGEEERVRDLVLRVFDEAVAPLFPEQGVREFTTYVQMEQLRTRSLADHFVLLALAEGEIVGMIEMRGCRHVSLLFVDGRFQRRGVARELLQQAMEACRSRGMEPMEVTVNSSPNSVQVYERLGFRATAPEQQFNGIRFTPMSLETGGFPRPEGPTET